MKPITQSSIKFLFLPLFVFFSFVLMSFEVGQTTVHFLKTNYKEALYQSKIRNKPLFIYICAESCTESQQQEDVFKMKETAIYINKNFTSNKIENPDAATQVLLNSKWQITSYPSFLFFNEKGKLLVKESGYKSRAKLMDMVQKAHDLNKIEISPLEENKESISLDEDLTDNK